MMHDQLMTLLQQGVGILLQLVVIVGIFFLRKLKDHLHNYYLSHTTNQQRQLLAQLGQEAFAYAETVYRQLDGPAKLNEATKYLLDKAQALGLGEVPMSDVRAVIESAWLQNKTQLGTTVSNSKNIGAGSEAMQGNLR